MEQEKIGFVAQDVEKIVPEVVVTDDSSGMRAVQYSRLVPLLVESIKHLEERVAKLEQRLARAHTARGTARAQPRQHAPDPLHRQRLCGDTAGAGGDDAAGEPGHQLAGQRVDRQHDVACEHRAARALTSRGAAAPLGQHRRGAAHGPRTAPYGT